MSLISENQFIPESNENKAADLVQDTSDYESREVSELGNASDENLDPAPNSGSLESNSSGLQNYEEQRRQESENRSLRSESPEEEIEKDSENIEQRGDIEDDGRTETIVALTASVDLDKGETAVPQIEVERQPDNSHSFSDEGSVVERRKHEPRNDSRYDRLSSGVNDDYRLSNMSFLSDVSSNRTTVIDPSEAILGASSSMVQDALLVNHEDKGAAARHSLVPEHFNSPDSGSFQVSAEDHMSEQLENSMPPKSSGDEENKPQLNFEDNSTTNGSEKPKATDSETRVYKNTDNVSGPVEKDSSGDKHDASEPQTRAGKSELAEDIDEDGKERVHAVTSSGDDAGPPGNLTRSAIDRSSVNFSESRRKFNSFALTSDKPLIGRPVYTGAVKRQVGSIKVGRSSFGLARSDSMKRSSSLTSLDPDLEKMMRRQRQKSGGEEMMDMQSIDDLLNQRREERASTVKKLNVHTRYNPSVSDVDSRRFSVNRPSQVGKLDLDSHLRKMMGKYHKDFEERMRTMYGDKYKDMDIDYEDLLRYWRSRLRKIELEKRREKSAGSKNMLSPLAQNYETRSAPDLTNDLHYEKSESMSESQQHSSDIESMLDAFFNQQGREESDVLRNLMDEMVDKEGEDGLEESREVDKDEDCSLSQSQTTELSDSHVVSYGLTESALHAKQNSEMTASDSFQKEEEFEVKDAAIIAHGTSSHQLETSRPLRDTSRQPIVTLSIASSPKNNFKRQDEVETLTVESEVSAEADEKEQKALSGTQREVDSGPLTSAQNSKIFVSLENQEDFQQLKNIEAQIKKVIGNSEFSEAKLAVPQQKHLSEISPNLSVMDDDRSDPAILEAQQETDHESASNDTSPLYASDSNTSGCCSRCSIL